MRKSLFAMAAAVATSVAISNYTPTPEERSACYDDAVRLCLTFSDLLHPSQIRARIFVCMLAHRQELSPQCAAVFKSHGL
jgi:hypothetical protein